MTTPPTPGVPPLAAPLLRVAEPPAPFFRAPPVVVDCSVLAGVLFCEPWADEAVQQLVGKRLHAPHLLAVELASVALKKHKQGLGEVAAEGLAQFAELDVALHPVAAEAVWALAQRHAITAYDAAYLWLAAELACPLLTFDQRLGDAAQAHWRGLS